MTPNIFANRAAWHAARGAAPMTTPRSGLAILVMVASVALAFPGFALAARPFVTDDARLTTSGSCQLESWLRVFPDSQELWALPACNPLGNLELTTGLGAANTHGESPTLDYAFQAKTLLRPLETNGWGLGLALGTIRHPANKPGPNIFGNTFAYVPLSLSFNDDQVIVHANLGWLRDKASGQRNASWGLGAEIRLTPALLGIAETYGDNQGSRFGQLGLRYALIIDLLQIDATYGQQLTGTADNMHWLSLGIRYTPAHFF